MTENNNSCEKLLITQEKQEIDYLIDLHDRIKFFKSQVSAKVLNSFSRVLKEQSNDEISLQKAKFMKVSDDYRKETEQIERLHLSSTATCAYFG